MTNCKLRKAIYTITDSIILTLQHQPGGYAFWMSLPQKGRHNAVALRKTLGDKILSMIFTPSFLAILLKSALTTAGQPINSPLYTWLLTNVYSNNIRKLYKDWLKINKA